MLSIQKINVNNYPKKTVMFSGKLPQVLAPSIVGTSLTQGEIQDVIYAFANPKGLNLSLQESIEFTYKLIEQGIKSKNELSAKDLIEIAKDEIFARGPMSEEDIALDIERGRKKFLKSIKK